MRNYSLYKQQRTLSSVDGPGMQAYEEPHALIDVGWYDRKNAHDQCAVCSTVVAIENPIISVWEETFDFLLCRKI